MKVFFGALCCLILFSCQEINNERSSRNEQRKEEVQPIKVLTFEDDVKPILAESCFTCHNDKALKDWTDFDTVVEYSDAILRSLKHEVHYKPMPMGKPKLQTSEIAVIKAWIENGMERGEIRPEGPKTIKKEDGSFAKQFYENKCSSCHEDNQNYPGLKGQPKEYIVTQLEDFKTGHRSNPTMSFFANDIIKDQETIEALAEYLSELKPCYKKSSAVTIKKIEGANGPDLENGKKLYEAKCTVCHSKSLTGTPNVLGLNGNYLVKVLLEMKTNYRPTTAMGRVLLDTTRQEILDMSYYLSKQSSCAED